MTLRDDVRIARRFQRSIKVESDIGNPLALDGYVCPASAADVLATMARHIYETRQSAFTWTGPYGSGKSSLALALCAAISSKDKMRHTVERTLGKSTMQSLARAFPVKGKPWRVLPITGRRIPLATLLGESLKAATLAEGNGRWTDERVLTTLATLARSAKVGSGLLILVDEMGKVLEGAAHDGHDTFLLQQIAELAARSEGRLVFIGILHQSFDEYAHRLASEVRDEWAKVQGRFVDLIVNTAGDEQIDLLARAIETNRRPSSFAPIAKAIAAMVAAGRPGATTSLPSLLARCWPLHPVTACLLGPLSRRRFGQNQRSLFAFLNSAEPFGLQDFLGNATDAALYGPEILWDYLRANLEPAILASSDGHRWSIAADAIERCQALGNGPLHVTLLKTIALIDLFRERSGLVASANLLAHCAPAGCEHAEIVKAVEQLQEQSLLVFRRHLSAYALHSGSDFDIEFALKTVMPKADALDLRKLHAIAGLQPVLAKRHYHESGAMRWCQLDLLPLKELARVLTEPEVQHDCVGRFLLVIPTEGETRQKATQLCQNAADRAPANIVIGLSRRAWDMVDLARELIALTTIYEQSPELRGDAIARREVLARLVDSRTRLEQQLGRMSDAADWYRLGEKPARLNSAALNHLASQLADSRYPEAPCIQNELLCRIEPSSNAVKAQKDLMRRMIEGEGQVRLGITGYPAEGGLCDSILLASRLYRADESGAWRFHSPAPDNDPARITSLWKAALDYLAEHSNETVALARLFDLWRAQPFGVKNGILPILAVALFLANRDKLAIYRQGVFQPSITELEIETLTSDAQNVQFRWMKLSSQSEVVLRQLADLATPSSAANAPRIQGPFDVARALIAIYEQLPGFTKRTSRLAPDVQKLSNLLRHAADPNKLLFNDLPALCSANANKAAPNAIASFVRDGLRVLKNVYPEILRTLEAGLLRELDVHDTKAESLNMLRERAQHLRQLSGDFRGNAFVARLAEYRGQLVDIEGLASLAINKRTIDWVDADVDEARLKLAQLAQRFILDEAFAHVDNRPNKRMRMAVVVPLHGQPRAMQHEFDVTDCDQAEIRELIAKVETALDRADPHRKNIILAALAELSARYMQDIPAAPNRKGRSTL